MTDRRISYGTLVRAGGTVAGSIRSATGGLGRGSNVRVTRSDSRRSFAASNGTNLASLLGMFIALATAPIYAHYTTVPRLFGTTVLQDQQWGGYIMWAPGSMMFIIAGLVLLYRQFQREDQGGPLDERVRLLEDTETPWAAPGVEQ